MVAIWQTDNIWIRVWGSPPTLDPNLDTKKPPRTGGFYCGLKEGNSDPLSSFF